MIRYYRRYVQVLGRFLPVALMLLRDRQRFILFGPARRVDEATHRRRAERLAEAMLELGPAFIKVGQVLSTRPDLVTPIYAEVFESLQDRVPENVGGDPISVVRAELEEDLDLATLEPLAGGSLAFVYTVEYEGERIALKVRRPGVVAIIERDLAVIEGLIPLIATFVDERKQYSIENLADDFRAIIREELEFDRERRIMEEIRENLAEEKRVRVPRSIPALSSERIVAMEYVPGTKVTRVAVETDADPTEVATLIARTYLKMGLVDGVYHADPHPGNLAITPDGDLVIYDFGMSQRLSSKTRDDIRGLYRSLVRRDVDGLLNTLIALDILEPTVDRVVARRMVTLVIENLEGRTDITWHLIMTELFANLRHLPVRIPPNVLLLLRVGTVGEGVCRSLDSDFDFVEAARRFLVDQGFIESELEALADELREDLRESAPVLAGIPARFDRVLAQLERGELVVRTEPRDSSRPSDRRTAYAVIGSALLVAAAILVFHEAAYELIPLLAFVFLVFRYFRSG